MQGFNRHRARLGQIIERAAARGVPPWKALLVELPEVLLGRVYRRLASSLYRMADRAGWQDARTRSFLREHPAGGMPRFCIIAVPRVMHFLVPAVRLIEDHADIVFVVNGLSGIERESLGRTFPAIPMLVLPTLPGSSWSHGTVLSLLLRTSPEPVGILDHDLFLFDPSVLRRLELAADEYALSLTGWQNRSTGLHFPGTHCMFLNVEPLRELMKRYSVRADLYKHLPHSTKGPLASLGLSMANPPKEYQRFFDSLLLLCALAIHHGLRARILSAGPEVFVHVGSTSMGSALTKDPVQQTVNARFLEMLEDTRLAETYRRWGVAAPESAPGLRRLIDRNTAERVNDLVARVRASIDARGA